jgi:hypothetical protein
MDIFSMMVSDNTINTLRLLCAVRGHGLVLQLPRAGVEPSPQLYATGDVLARGGRRSVR